MDITDTFKTVLSAISLLSNVKFIRHNYGKTTFFCKKLHPIINIIGYKGVNWYVRK